MTLSATYSPEDNKLRLYSVARLPTETYERVKAAGFRWAPKQDLFVAPTWTPSREDLLTDLCGEIGDEDTSLVQRAEERADRFGDYSDKRASDAEAARSAVSAIADNIPFGQPILIGHHSERRARKDAERIENGMRRAVKMWETSEYWERRATGALQNAKYKERPDVRHRRIKTIEADKRKQERAKAEYAKWLTAWSKPELTHEEAVKIATFCRLSLPRKEGDRPDFDQRPTAYDTLTNTYPSLYTPRTVDEVVAHAKQVYPRWIAHAERWIAHYENRIAYERAMLNEQGGTAADKFAVEVGGEVLIGGTWYTVTRVNKSGGAISSVTTNARYVRVRGIEEVQDYRAPSAEEAAKVKAATKLPPLVNYPGEGFAHMTKAEFDRISKDYRGTAKKAATEASGAHRVRSTLGVFAFPDAKDSNKRHVYHGVYITDAKRVDPPAPAAAEPVEALRTSTPAPACLEAAAPVEPQSEDPVQTQPNPMPEPAESDPAPAAKADRAEEFRAMKEQLRQGVQTVSAPQLFPTPTTLAARMADLANIQPGDRVLEPSAGTGRLLGAFGGRMFGHNPERGEVVAVEIVPALAQRLRTAFPLTAVHCGDFLECGEELGKFDAVIMNPPFANAQDIAHIKHARTLLAPGGVVVAICANGPRQNDQLRPLVHECGGMWEPLPAGTFEDSGTSVNTVLLTLHG